LVSGNSRAMVPPLLAACVGAVVAATAAVPVGCEMAAVGAAVAGAEVGVAAGPQAVAAIPRTITNETILSILLFIFYSYLRESYVPSKGQNLHKSSERHIESVWTSFSSLVSLMRWDPSDFDLQRSNL
jgi:hypothetical protein